MTDDKKFDDLKKQAERLNRDLENLGGTATKNINDFITAFGGGIEGAQKAIANLRNQIKDLDTDINYLSGSLSNVVKELSKDKTFNKETEKSFKKLASLANELYNDQNRINTLSEKELKNIAKKVGLEKESLEKSLKGNIAEQKSVDTAIKMIVAEQQFILDKDNITKADDDRFNNLEKELKKQKKIYDDITTSIGEAENFLYGDLEAYNLLLKVAEDRLVKEQKINNKLGISGSLVEGMINSLEKLGINSKFFEDVKQDMLDAAEAAGSTKWGVFGAGIKSAWSGLKEGLKDPVTQLVLAKKAFEFFLNAAIKSNKESVNLSKNLGYGAANADRVRANFASIESSSNNLNVTTANLSEAFNELSSATGFVTEYSADALETQIKLTKQLGLSGDEAAGVYELSVLNGKSSEATYQSMLKGYVNTRNSLKVGIPFKAAIAEASKVSGQLAANMGYNTERIISGVVATKALGTSLEQAKSQGASLLEFQSSIEDELQAELITGKQLNLERARAAALMGDQVAVAEELAAQGMTSTEFSNMNVIAQNAYAKALGTTSNELADQLKKREVALASGKSLAEITAEEAEEAAKRQDVQTKFNAAMEKLQSTIGNLVAGPLGSFLEILSEGLDIINKIAPALRIITGLYLIIKGIQMAGNVFEAGKTAQLALQGDHLAFQNILQEKSLIKKAMYHAIALKEAFTEEGIAGIKTYVSGLDEKSLVRRIIMGAITAKEWVYQKGIALWELAKTGYEKISLGLKFASSAIEKGNLLKSIGSAVMGVVESLSSIPVIGWALGLTAAAGVAALGYKFLKGDDIMSKNGYGKRTLLAPEGAIRLNDKDTIIAGTNLGLNNSVESKTPTTPNKVDNSIKPITPRPISINYEIKKPTTSTPSIQSVNPSINSAKKTQNNQPPPLDLTPMISVMNDVKSAIGHLNNKKWDVYLDSSRVGRGMVKGQTQSA
jgi:hypothetical protein